METIAWPVVLIRAWSFGTHTEEHSWRHILDMDMKFWMLRVPVIAGINIYILIIHLHILKALFKKYNAVTWYHAEWTSLWYCGTSPQAKRCENIAVIWARWIVSSTTRNQLWLYLVRSIRLFGAGIVAPKKRKRFKSWTMARTASVQFRSRTTKSWRDPSTARYVATMFETDKWSPTKWPVSVPLLFYPVPHN